MLRSIQNQRIYNNIWHSKNVKKLINYLLVDHAKNNNFVIDHVNISGHLKTQNFKFQKYKNLK
jgi:hypothetical protein